MKRIIVVFFVFFVSCTSSIGNSDDLKTFEISKGVVIESSDDLRIIDIGRSWKSIEFPSINGILSDNNVIIESSCNPRIYNGELNGNNVLIESTDNPTIRVNIEFNNPVPSEHESIKLGSTWISIEKPEFSGVVIETTERGIILEISNGF